MIEKKRFTWVYAHTSGEVRRDAGIGTIPHVVAFLAAANLNAEADGPLIAAAPDLLEACKAVLRMSVVCPEDIAAEVELCRAAVARAENQ